MIKGLFAVVTLGIAAVSAGPAQALNTRTWVSGTGIDQSGCGPIANPCRTLQYAHDQTSAGCEVNFKDSAGYGSVAITKAISVIAGGVFAGVLASSGGNAITIDAGATSLVVLRGLTIEGAKVGTNGIVFTSGGILDVSDCLIQNFVNRSGPSGHGILLQPASDSPAIFIRRTVSSHNTNYGINYHPTAGSNAAPTISIEDTTLADNRGGFAIDAPVTTGTTRVSIANTNAHKNINDGFYIFDSRAIVSFDLCSADMNGRNGFTFDNGAFTVGRSRGTNNTGYGLVSSVGVSSFGNNQFSGNGSGQTNATFVGTALK